MQKTAIVLNEEDIKLILNRLTYEMLEIHRDCHETILIGLYTRGVHLADRISKLIFKISNLVIPVGYLDITLYRDDINKNFPKTAQRSKVDHNITGKKVIIVDDVLNSGRTIRASLDALNDYGRPASVELLVLIDKGARQLPIAPNYTGKILATPPEERINVHLTESDGIDQVTIT